MACYMVLVIFGGKEVKLMDIDRLFFCFPLLFFFYFVLFSESKVYM